MIDALLYAVRDAIRSAGFNYDHGTCEIMDSGEPPPGCGNFFVAIHGGKSRPGGANLNNLDELFGFSVTLTARVTVPLDRVGDQQIARNLARVPQALRDGFNAKVEQLSRFLHMNWRVTVLQGQSPNSANDNIAAWVSGFSAYGFVEPAHYEGIEGPRLVGGEWFAADPESEECGIVAELKFDGARRMQPLTLASGSFQ